MRRNSALRFIVLCVLLSASLIVRASVVQSEMLPLASEIETKDTIHVYPSTVENGAWAGVENVLSPDLSEDAIYQDFSARNAAYVPLTSTIVPDVKINAEAGTAQTENATPTDASTMVGSDASATAPVEPAPAQKTDETGPSTDAAPQSGSTASEQPVSLKKASANFFTLFSEVTRFLPFALESETASSADAGGMNPPVPVTASQDAQQRTASSSENAATTASTTTVLQTSGFSTTTFSGTTTTPISASTTAVSSNTDQQASLPSASKTITLSDFSTPELSKGEYITSMQLRMSLAAKYIKHTDTAAPIITITYKTPSSTQEVGRITLDDEVSNALNGGYFLFALPNIADVSELSHASVEVTYSGDTQSLDGVYLDAVWLEINVAQIDPKLLKAKEEADLGKHMRDPKLSTMVSTARDFTRAEAPRFSLRYKSQRNVAVQFIRNLFGRPLAQVNSVQVIHNGDGQMNVSPQVSVSSDGLINIDFSDADKRRMEPGDYTVSLGINEGGSLFTDSFTFQWGVLSINPDKTSYAIDEPATISMGALSPNGNTICDANLELFITDEHNNAYPVAVTPSGACNGNNVVDIPDYSALFTPHDAGTYTMHLERLDGEGTIIAHSEDTFLVAKDLPLSIRRIGPSRIYPKASYPMSLTVLSESPWKGTLIEQVPSTFDITDTDAKITQNGDMKELAWDIDTGSALSQTVSYTFNAPDLSPYLYNVGTASLIGETPISANKNKQDSQSLPQAAVNSAVASSSAIEQMPASSTPEAKPKKNIIQKILDIFHVGGSVKDSPATSSPEMQESATSQPTAVTEGTTTPTLMNEPSNAGSTSAATSGLQQSIAPSEQLALTLVASSTNADSTPVGNGPVFAEHRTWQIASDATGNMILYWDGGTSLPSGWTCLSCGSGVFFQRFAMGSSTYNSTGGSATHTHSASATVYTSSGAGTENFGSGAISIVSHTHTLTPTIGSASSLPSYRQLRVIEYTAGAGEPANIPTGAIGVFDATVPAGWTRYSSEDNYFLYGENSPGTTGGSNTHTHTITGTLSAAAGTDYSARGGGTQAGGASTGHTHTISSNTASTDNRPPFIGVILGKLSATTTPPNGLIAMWSNTVPSGWLDESSAGGSAFSNRFIVGSSTYGVTGGASTHTPADVTGITTSAPSATTNGRTGSAGASAAHTHLVDVTGFSSGSNLPPYITVIFGKRQGTNPVYEQLSYRWYANTNAQTPTDPWPSGATDIAEKEAVTSTSTPIKDGGVIRLRMSAKVTNATTTTGTQFKLQYGTTTALCSAIASWHTVGNTASTTQWRGYDNAGVSDNGTLTSMVLASSTKKETYQENGFATGTPNAIGINGVGEWDYVLQENNAAAGTNYCFRMVKSDGSAFSTYSAYPKVLVNSAPVAPTLTKLFDNEKTASTTGLQFQFHGSDPESDDLDYEVQIDNNYDFSSTAEDKDTVSNSSQFDNLTTPADKAPFNSGDIMQFTSSATLTNGTTYYWRVRAKDASGSGAWGSWSTIRSFTVDTSLTASGWFQTKTEQFNTDTLNGILTSSDQMSLKTGSTTGTATSSAIVFTDGSLGTAWDSLVFNQTVTSGSIHYKIQYYDSGTASWANIPDSALSGNSSGFTSSPVDLLGLDTNTYGTIRIVATLTYSGGSPSIQDWGIKWGYRVQTPTITKLFPNEKVGTTTPIFQFTTTDPQSDSLTYQVQWSTSYAFTSSTTRTSSGASGFTNLSNGGDTDPFNSGDSIQFHMQAADALTNGTTYWWRVRAKDTTGANQYSFWTDPRSFTVDTSVVTSTWFETTQSQFNLNTLSGTIAGSGGSVSVATTASEAMLAYGDGTTNIPKYRQWDGSAWGAQGSMQSIGAPLKWIRVKAGTTREEFVAASIGTDNHIVGQVFKDGAWGNTQTITTGITNVNARGFDVAYETNSGNAMVVYCSGTNAAYYTWNGSSWTSGGTITLASGNNCEWIELAADPTSNEIIMLTRDSTGSQYEAQVWSGSAWGNSTTLGSISNTSNEGMAVQYEESGNQAVIVVSDGNPSRFRWNSWNGTAWGAAATQSVGSRFEWGTLVRDKGSDEMALCYQDNNTHIGMVQWTGSAWTGQTELLTTTGKSNTDPGFSCAYEDGGSRDNYIMTAYTDTAQMNYSYWNNTAWSAGAQISSMTDAVTSKLIRTGVGKIIGLFFDDTNDHLLSSSWNGTSWATPTTVGSDASVNTTPFGKPYDLTPRNSGTQGTVIVSPAINFTDGSGPYWQELSWNDSTPGTSDIRYSVEYYSTTTSSWAFIPDTDLSGNSTGFTTGPVDLTGLNKNKYGTIRPYAVLSCDGVGNCPTLNDWTVKWAQGITVSGTIKQYDESTNVTSGTVAIALNGTLQSGKTGSISGGTWSVANINAGAGDTITAFLTGAADANEAVGVTKYDGLGNVTGMNLFERHLSIGSDDNATVGNSDLSGYDFTKTEDVFYDVNGSNDLAMCATTGCGDAKLYIKAGNTYQPGTGADVATYNFENNGTLKLNGNTMRVSGSWDNNATTSLATSTVIMNATSSPKTLDETGAASPSFYNLTFGTSTSTASWSLITPLTVNNNLTVTGGTLSRGTQPITVAGNLQNAANGVWSGNGTTTFNGSAAKTWSDANATLQNVGRVVVDGTAKTVTLAGNVKAYSVTIGSDDTLDLSTSNYGITVLSNWKNNHTFNARAGTVSFAATSTGKSITTGGSSFYDLAFTGAGGGWSFTDSAISVSDNFSITAAGTVTLPTATTTIGGSFTNSAGTFVHNNGIVSFNSVGTKTITQGGTAFTNAFYDVRFGGSGTWSFTEANATTSHNFKIVQGAVTFPSNTLSVGGSFINSAGTFTHNSGTVKFYSSGSETVSANSAFNSLLFAGSGSYTFSNTTVTAAGNVTIASGTVTFPSSTFTIGGSFANSASFASNGGTVIFNASAAGKTINPGNSSFTNLQFNSATGGWTISNNATSTASTTLTSVGALTLASGKTLSVGGVFTNNAVGASTTWAGSTLALRSGSYSINSKSSFGDSYGTLRIDSSAHIKMWNSQASAYSVNGAGSLYSQDHAGVDGALNIYGAYTRSSGTENWSYATDFDGTALTVGARRQAHVYFASGASASLTGSVLSIQGTTSASTTISNQGSGTYTIGVTNGTTTANRYSFADLGSTGLSLLGTNRVTSLSYGTFTPATNSGAALTVSSTTINANAGLQIFNVGFSTSSAITAYNVTQTGGTPSSYWWFRNSYGNLDGEAHDNDTGDPGSIRWDDSSLVITVSGKVYSDEGITPLVGGTCNGSTNVVRVVVDGGATYDGSCSNVDGSYSISGVTILGDPVITVFLNNASGGEKAVALTKTPTGNITGLDLYAHRTITRHQDVSPMTIADMAKYDSSKDSDILFTAATGTVNTLSVAANSALYLWASSTFTPGGTITLHSGGTGTTYDGSLHLAPGATFTGAGTTTYTIGGTLTLDAGSTFIPASSTVVMSATTSGKAITVASGNTAHFNLLSFTGVGGDWNINGDILSENSIHVAAGTVTGTGNIHLKNGSFYGNGALSLGGGTTTIDKSNTLGGTQGWTFNNLTLGSGTVTGTTTPGSTATTTIAARLKIATGHFLNAGSSVFDLSGSGTVFVENGTFLEGTSKLRYSGSGATNILSTGYYDLDLNAGAGTPTYTATGLGIQVHHDLSVGGASPTVVDLNANDPAFAVTGNVVIRSNGTLSASGSGSFTVGGNWSNSGTFTANSGTVSFNGSGSPTINAGASSFGTVIINGTGSFTIVNSATSTGAFTLASTTGAFTLASGKTLSVGGAFSNGLGGANTTWTGSTLYLHSGTNYAINTKSVSDAYETLKVGANTDIRMWNSQANIYTIDSTGSLYSMDHAAVDGSLYIYGNYPGSGGTDYWNYAKDFDGASLGSPRAATVRFQSGASMDLISGGLQVLGSSGASTTIENQGSGTYGLHIGGTASTSWSYYRVFNTNGSGLALSGTPNVVTLSRGYFEVSQASGTAMTVGGTAINANPAKTFTNNVFATTSAIRAFNVTATGTAVSSWRFTNHSGNLAGEAHDIDPNGDPGYIVWDDSAANITISGHVYSDEGLTVSSVCDGSTADIHIRVAGLTTYTGSCNASTGAYSISGVSYSPGDSLVAYISGKTQKAAAVTKDPISNITDLDLYEHRVIVRHENTSALTIANMAIWDSSDDSDIPFTATVGSPNTLSLPSNTKLIVWSNKSFAPGGNMTLAGGGAGAAYDGSLEVYANGALTFAGTETHSIGGSFVLDSGATFTPGQGTTTFTTTGASRTIDTNSTPFYNVALTGSGSWSISDPILGVHTLVQTAGTLTLPAGTTTISGSWIKNGGSFTNNGSPMRFTATSSGNTVKFGGSSVASLVFAGTGGSWNMTDANATSTGSMTIAHGDVTLPSGSLALRGSFKNLGGSVTHNTDDLIFEGTSTAATLLASSSDLYTVRVNGSGGLTMADHSLTLANSLIMNAGTTTLASGTLSIGGSLSAATGAFKNATGTILFNATTTGKTVNPGNSRFYNVNFGSASGGWTISNNATTTHNFTLSSANAFTLTSGKRLYVGGVFTNSVGGAATTWTGSTLALGSGNTYAINTKSAGGDNYDTLIVGANTDISTWNSHATTTTIASSSSFYSMDHAGVDGSLYIYGDYHISTTSQYWSYAKDFDGTSLSGGSERTVTVHIAQNATTTLDGGSLTVTGAGTHETTITNQGSGAYAFKVSAGTLSAQYYKFRNLNSTGLSISGTPTISNLSYGDFELSVGGGHLITLTSGALDANASLVITGNRFATTTAITGYNVYLQGSTSNAWTFVSHTGNLAGEAFDFDGATLCGSIRWSDSSCLITQETHYRYRNDDGGIDVPNSEWYNPSWTERKSVRITNNDGTAYTNPVVHLHVTYDSDMNSNFSDVRFTDSSGTTTIPYYIEKYTPSTDADIWVKMPSLAANATTPVYMYFKNGSATTTTSSSTATFIAADDFEDGNISEYSGDTILFGVNTNHVDGGTYGLDNAGNTTAKANYGIARFDQTVSQGERLRYKQYVSTSGGADEVCTMFGVQSPVTAKNNYGVCLEQVVGQDYMAIVKNVDHSAVPANTLASTSVNYTAGWYEVDIDWKTNNTISVSLYNSSNTLVATTSATDSTYTSGGYGYTFWYNSGGWDSYFARPIMTNEPTAHFGAKQTDGGATWAGTLDDPITMNPGDHVRMRTSVENSGLQITNQTFDLEYASKGAAPSCEAVPSANFATVPVSASCGSSPLCMATSSHISNNSNTTDLLNGPTGDFTAGKVVTDPSYTTSALTLNQDAYTELEYVLKTTNNATSTAYCMRVTDGGTPLDTYLSLPELDMRFDPVISALSLNGGQDIALTPGATTTVYATGTVTDLNGYTDFATATGTIYRSGAGALCSPNENNCYSATGSQCQFSNCAGNSCEISCSADISYFADPTDAGAYAGEEWLAYIEVADHEGGIGVGSAPGVEMLSLRALNVSSNINYGSLAVASSTGNYNPTTTVANIGNSVLNLQVEGTDLSDGGVSSIPASEQLFATSSFNYSACTYCKTLSTTTTQFNLDLTKPTSFAPVTGVIYWGIYVPFGVSAASHHGTNTFYAAGP